MTQHYPINYISFYESISFGHLGFLLMWFLIDLKSCSSRECILVLVLCREEHRLWEYKRKQDQLCMHWYIVWHRRVIWSSLMCRKYLHTSCQKVVLHEIHRNLCSILQTGNVAMWKFWQDKLMSSDNKWQPFNFLTHLIIFDNLVITLLTLGDSLLMTQLSLL